MYYNIILVDIKSCIKEWKWKEYQEKLLKIVLKSMVFESSGLEVLLQASEKVRVERKFKFLN